MTTTGQAAVIGLYGMAPQDLSYDPGFLLLLFVLLIIILGRVIISTSRRYAE